MLPKHHQVRHVLLTKLEGIAAIIVKEKKKEKKKTSVLNMSCIYFGLEK